MKFQLSYLLVIAFIGIASVKGNTLYNGLQSPSEVYPAFLGGWNFGFGSPMQNNNNIGNMINNLECRLSFAVTAAQIREVFKALADDTLTANVRFRDSRYNEQLRQNLNKYFEDLRVFNDLAEKYFRGQMPLLQYIKENFLQHFRLVKNIIVGKIYLIRAGIEIDHLLPKTHQAFKNLMKTLYDDLSCLIMHPSKVLSYFSEVMNLLMGRNMLSMNMGMSPLSPMNNMLGRSMSFH